MSMEIAREPALSLTEVCFRYRRGAQALDNCTFSVPAGALALLGPNGAGKTTLLNLLVGTASPESGYITMLGGSLSDSSWRRRTQASLGVVPQRLAMFPAYTCEELLRYVAWLRKVPRVEVDRRIAVALEVVQLTLRAKTQIKRLSGGMRQRLALAQAIVNDPKVLVLDEPTVGLDPQQRVEFRQYLTTLKRDRLIVFASHLVEDVAAVADNIVVLDQGRVLYSGTVAAFGGGDIEPATGPRLEAAYLQLLERSG